MSGPVLPTPAGVPVRLTVSVRPRTGNKKWEIWRFARGGRAVLVAMFEGTAVRALVAYQKAVDAYPGERVRLQTDNHPEDSGL